MDIVSPRIESWRISPRHAAIAGILCWAGFGIVVALVEAGHGAAFDALGLRFWRQSDALGLPRGPIWLLEAVRDYTALGGVLLRNLFALGAASALLFLGLRREALLFCLTVTGAWLVEYAIKVMVGRPRPQVVPHLVDAGGGSFPSGHSFNAAVIYVSMSLAFAAISPRRSIRWTTIGVAMVLSLLVALSRVWLGVHYPTDAIAGWLGGAGWAFIASAVLYKPTKRMSAS